MQLEKPGLRPGFFVPADLARTMSSQEIAELVGSRHDKVKQSIDRLAERGAIQLPPLGEVKNHLGQTVFVYRVCKRDSFVVVAQLSPEFTAALVDRWQELERQAAQPHELSTIEILQIAMESERARLMLLNYLVHHQSKIWSKAVKPLFSAMIKTIEILGNRYGNSMFQNVCLLFAPSIAAASVISLGMV